MLGDIAAFGTGFLVGVGCVAALGVTVFVILIAKWMASGSH